MKNVAVELAEAREAYWEAKGRWLATQTYDDDKAVAAATVRVAIAEYNHRHSPCACGIARMDCDYHKPVPLTGEKWVTT